MHIFYYGIWLAGAAGLISMIITAISNRQTLKDISRMPRPRGRWLQAFYEDLEQARNGCTEVKNPMVFVTRRMNGRKIGRISQHRMKGIMWYAFVLSFLFMGIACYLGTKAGTWTIQNPFSQPQLILAGIGVPVGLVLIRQFLGISYQEKCICADLLDYMENTSQVWTKDKLKTVTPIREEIPAQPISQTKPARMPKRDRNQKAVSQEREKEAVKEKIMEQISRGIQETAASKGKYEHLLSKEEEQIIRDVISEFLT